MIGIVKLALRPSVHFYRYGAADHDLRRRIGPPHADRHLPEHQYTGDQASSLAIPASRLTTWLAASVTYYERSLTTSVNDIAHIESQSIPNYGIIRSSFSRR